MSFESNVTFVLQNLAQIMPFLAVISISVNTCHLIVLTRKTITSSSMNTLLIGIAIVDILSPMVYVERGIGSLIEIWEDFCQFPTYNEVFFDLILGSLSENFRRCSTWLGLLLAVTRTISVKLAVERSCKFLSTSRFGVILIFCTISISLPIVIPFLIRYQIVQSDPHFCRMTSGQVILVTKCTIQEFSENNTVIGGSARTIHILVTGIFGQLVPSILFPIFASILICELRKPEKKNSTTVKVKADKISRMVIYMTITFLVIEFPIGVGKIFNAMQTESTIPHDVNQIFHYIYVPMTLMHCFICLSMSTQYQNTARRLLGFRCKNAPKTIISSNSPVYIGHTSHK